MRGINLILRNSFRNTFRHPTKLLGLSALVALLALVLSLVVNLNIRVIIASSNLRDQSHLHTIVMPLDPFERVPIGSNDSSPIPQNAVAAQQYWLYKLQEEYKNDPEKSFYWSRTEGREFSQVFFGSDALTLKVLTKVTPQNNLNNYPHGVDDLIVFSGRKPTPNQGHEVVVDPVFAQKHGLKINEIIRIQADNFGTQLVVDSPQNENITPNFLSDLAQIKAGLETPDSKGINDPDGLYQKKYAYSNDWYQIVGLGSSADFTMPILNQTTPIPNRQKEALLYVDSSNFGLSPQGDLGFYYFDQRVGRLLVSSQTEWESFYSLANKSGRIPSPQALIEMNQKFQELIGKPQDGRKYLFAQTDSSYRYAARTQALQMTLKYYSIGISAFLVLLIIVIVFSISLVIEKLVDNSRGQVGILKALGYTKSEIALNYFMVPLFVSVIGGIVGFAIAIPITNLLIREFMNYFVLNYGKSGFNWWAFIIIVAGFFIFLNLITFVVINIVVQKNTAELVSGHKKTKVSIWSQWWKSQVADQSFNVRLQTALLLRASGKMTLVGVIVFIATTLFTISFAGPDILSRNQTASFYGVKYRQLVEYVEPVYNNPFTFYRTFNIEDNLTPPNRFQWSEELKKYTSLPLKENPSQVQGGYDLDKIASAYYNNTKSGEYYSLGIPTLNNQADGSIDVITPNMRLLASNWAGLSIEFYRFMAQQGVPYDAPGQSPALGVVLFNQWPIYVALMEQLKTEDLRQNLKDLQYFYNSVISGIGVSLTNWFWLDQAQGRTLTENQKIEIFNEDNQPTNYPNSQLAARKALDYNTSYDQSKFNSQLKSVIQEVVDEGEEFKFTDENWGVGKYHIQPPGGSTSVNPSDYFDDFYSLMDVDRQSDSQVREYLKKMIVWFGSLISGRFDQGIIQAAYSRPSYFVQQSMKNAYNQKGGDDSFTPYFQAFGNIPYNNKLEQYGLFFRVQAGKNHDKAFKIYGVENNSRFLDLRNRKDNNLIQQLYAAKRPKIGADWGYNIIVNQSVARSLDLEKDSIVSWEVLQKELQDNSVPSRLDTSWKTGLKPSNGSFNQINDIDNNGWAFINSEGRSLQLNFILSGITNQPGPYYEEFLDGKLQNKEIAHEVKFKVLDIHDGYGDPQAWIKNEDALEILNFAPLREFFWSNFFASQWNETFAQTNLHINPNQTLEFVANPRFSFKGSTEMQSYAAFQESLLKSEDPQIQHSAQIIDQIFKNSFPLFNYKYSNKTDVADLNNAVSVFQEYGDYSPIALNGVTTPGSTVEGIGQGAIDNIIPVSIKKAILDQMSALVYLIMVLAILAILIITFVIVFLTVNLIIDDNIEFIATLKVLGYSNNYIVKAILSMYFIVIGITFIIGLAVGWIAFVAIVRALQSTIVLPLYFPLWLPFAVAMGVIGIYAITFAVGYWVISHTNPLTVLQSQVK